MLSLVGLAVGAVVGLTAGPLWLDEALSVEIARLPVPDLLAALRRDGSPPLYYLLLHGWTALFGTGTIAVRLPSVLLTVVALLLAHRLGGQLAGRSGARAAVVVLAVLPWTIRFASETRMYLLVVVLVLAGALALRAVHARVTWQRVLALGVVTGALLLTHYWALFLVAVVGLLHLPGLLRGARPAVGVALAGAVGALLFLPWLPAFLFQAAHTGAPWADPPALVEVLRTPRYWGGGSTGSRTVLAWLLVPLAAVACLRGSARRPARALVAVAALTLLLAFAVTVVAGGAWTGRYTAVAVPLVTTAVALGALALPGQGAALVALTAVAGVGLSTGIAAVTVPRASAADIADTVRSAAAPGAVLLFCPDQLAPPVQRLLGPAYQQVVYPTLGPPQLVDWVDYAERNAAADPAEVARRVDALAGDRPLLVLKASGYRTFGDDCDRLLDEVAALRGDGTHLFGELGTTGQLLFRHR